MNANRNLSEYTSETILKKSADFLMFKTEGDCIYQQELNRMISALKLRHSVNADLAVCNCKAADPEGVRTFFKLLFRHLIVRTRPDFAVNIITEKNKDHFYIRIRYIDRYSFVYNKARIMSKRTHDLIDAMHGALVVNEMEGFDVRILIILPLTQMN
jgi:hypothetical protein